MKNRIKKYTLLAFLALSSGAITAQENTHKIDQWLEARIEKDFSTAGMIDALHQAGEMWDKQMNVSYKYLMTKLKPEQKLDLKKSQRAWIAFRDAESKVARILSNPYFGSMGRVAAVNEYYEMVKSRAQTLALYESSIRELHDDEVTTETNHNKPPVKEK